MMKNHRLIAILIATFSLGFILIATTQPVSAKNYTTVPTSLRGHWYHYDSDYTTYDQLKASKYHFDSKSGLSNSWYRLSGKTFPSYAMGHSQLVVKRTPKKYYVVARYATDSLPYWKKVSHKGHIALRAVVPSNMETEGSTTYWYKSKKIARHPSQSAYKAFHGYHIETGKHGLTNNTFYYKKTHMTISDYRPTQKSKVIFEYGSHVYPTHHEWIKVVGDYLTSYTYKNGKWHKGKTTYVPD